MTVRPKFGGTMLTMRCTRHRLRGGGGLLRTKKRMPSWGTAFQLYAEVGWQEEDRTNLMSICFELLDRIPLTRRLNATQHNPTLDHYYHLSCNPQALQSLPSFTNERLPASGIARPSTAPWTVLLLLLQ